MFHPDRGFPRLGGEKGPLHPHNIPQIEQLKHRQLPFRQSRFLDIDLQSPRSILQVQKLAFSHVPMGNDPARHPHAPSLLPTPPDLPCRFRSGKSRSKRIHPQTPHLLQLLSSRSQQRGEILAHRSKP